MSRRRTIVVVTEGECGCQHESRSPSSGFASAAVSGLAWATQAIVVVVGVASWSALRVALALALWALGRFADGIRAVETAAGGGPSRLAPGLLPFAGGRRSEQLPQLSANDGPSMIHHSPR